MEYPLVGRNEPCPCGSGKKFKKCHGEGAQRMTPQSMAQSLQAKGGGEAAGLDPSANPAMMNHMMKAFQRLPKAQLIRFQNLMQNAMAGKDVTKEASELEKMLPPQFQQMMISMTGAMGMASQNATESAADNLSEEEARRIVEEAAKSGKISADQAQELLAADSQKEKRSGGFWKSLIGKKE